MQDITAIKAALWQALSVEKNNCYAGILKVIIRKQASFSAGFLKFFYKKQAPGFKRDNFFRVSRC